MNRYLRWRTRRAGDRWSAAGYCMSCPERDAFVEAATREGSWRYRKVIRRLGDQ